ncbi:MAG TPA: sulfotransferase [Woeseiaceae bacterium]|nr:sulfotransferase [Woeseiaceae bacterium]
MLEAHLKIKSLDHLAAQLPKDVINVKRELGSALDENPPDKSKLLLLVRCHLLCDEPQEARHALEVLTEHHPDAVQAKVELSKILGGSEEYDAAIGLLRDVTAARPEITESWQLLGEYLKQSGQSAASQDALNQLKMIRTFNTRLHAAEQAFMKGDFQAADSICRQLLQLVPNEVRTLRLLSRIARQFRHYEFSTSTLARCIETRPRDSDLGLDYAYSLLASRRYRDALDQCERLIELAPEKIDVYDLKAELLYYLGRFDEAIELYRALAELDDKRALRLLALGKLLKTVGDSTAATECYQQAIAADPTSGQAYWELADLKTYRFSESEIAAMSALLDAGNLKPLNRVLIQFALGKANEDAKQYAESFKHYDAANSEYAALRPSPYLSHNGQFTSVFTNEYFTDRKAFGNDTDAPIFIVGLPRSGSTLLEQILASHSQVDATQELDEIVSIVRDVSGASQPGQHQYPQVMTNLDAGQISDLARRYLEYAQQYRQQAPRFIDKAPHNFQHIGLIKTLFPNARIIDIRRNPMASGWSVYKQFFAESFLFSYSLETIGRYYNDYIELMNHWHAVLPGQILTISYEDLVADLPATVSMLLQYCDLEFEAACLSFHLNERAVSTPSSEQVRQPLYSDAVQQWKHYEAFLDPLKKAVGYSNDAVGS